MLSNYLKKGRDPGWIELFFDLAYVVMLGRLAHLLFHTHEGIIPGIEIFNFIWIFSLAFVIWMYFTVFMNIYGNDRGRQDIFSFILMIGLFGIVLFMHDIDHLSVPIGLTIASMAFFLSIIYRIVKNRIPENKKYAEYKSRSLLIVAILIVPMIFMPHVMGMLYVALIMAVEHFFDERVIMKNYALPPDGKHFIERIGIFMIVLFGESLITLVYNLPEEMRTDDYVIAALLLVTLFFVWMNYFGDLEKLTEVKYQRYSQILLTNMFVMFALTLLSAIIYHGLIREMDVLWFKGLVLAFMIAFYEGNGITYYRSGAHSRVGAYLYANLPVILTLVVFYKGLGYLETIAILFGINMTTALAVVLGKRKREKVQVEE